MTYVDLLASDRRSDIADLADYFRRLRAQKVGKYFAAPYPSAKQNARRWVLHYGKLIRKLEAAQ